MALFAEGNTGTKLMPTQLYIDIMIMIKNVFFCVAKAKVDNENGRFFVVLLGTDRLKTLFGILRTMVGNDVNVDALPLGNRITGTTEVSTILAKHPEWDRAPRRLKLPILNKDGLEMHNGVDHIGPASWRGVTQVASVNLQTTWKLGRRLVEKEFPHLVSILESLSGFDIFSPLGKDLIKAPWDSHDVDDTVEDYDASETEISVLGTDIEDAAAEQADTRFQPCFELNGKKVYKARYLSQHVQEINIDFLMEPTTFVTYQVLDLISATQADDPELKNDWRSSGRCEASHPVAGRLVVPINPTVSTCIAGEPYYLFESGILMAFGATLLEQICGAENIAIPQMKKSDTIPYRESL
ncbi:hypothetical protein H0H87_003144, partial [Tephrocybe sp. NHM501043]